MVLAREGNLDVPPAESILSAAARLFADKGYDAASMREIAEAAGVTKPTIYYHFKSKLGLFEAILKAGVSSLCGSLEEINSREASFDGRKCLEDAVFATLEFAREHSDLNRFIHNLVFSPQMRPERQAIEEAFARVIDEFRRILARAANQGLLDPSRIPAAGLAVRGTIMTYVTNYLQGQVEFSRKLASDIVEGFLYGYCARPCASGGLEPQ